ncbi:MAG: HAD hydrolase-like protein [bacterium]|nr:HAD hydrolase-like protein [bacterium]
MSIINLSNLLKAKGKTHLFIDFDGTLCFLDMDWSGWAKGVESVLEKFGPNFEHGLETLDLSELQNQYFERFGKEARDAVTKFTSDYENEHFGGYKLSEQVLEVVNNDNFVKYLWSSNTRETVMKILDKELLSDKFTKIITRDDVLFVKPNPYGFNFVYDKVTSFAYDESVSKEKYAMIGDSSIDQEAAKNAGIEFFKVAS